MPPSGREPASPAAWTFLTNHSHVLICLARDPFLRLRDVAALVGITERAVQRIVGDLEEGGVLTRLRDGRRNRYEIHPALPLRHPIEANCTVGELIGMASLPAAASSPPPSSHTRHDCETREQERGQEEGTIYGSSKQIGRSDNQKRGN